MQRTKKNIVHLVFLLVILLAMGLIKTVDAEVLTPSAGESKTLRLYQNHPEDNQPFQVGNMFPGDAEKGSYRLLVSYQGEIVVHFGAGIRPGGEKLSEVLRARVTIGSASEPIYDGLLRDLSDLTYSLRSSGSSTDELLYQVVVYLDPSVGNDYQNLSLTADFRWWVEESDSGILIIPPQTGAPLQRFSWPIMVMVALGITLLVIIIRRRKEGSA